MTILLLLCLSASLMQAQITIGGNVYGGGNAGNLGGQTTVNIYAGDLHNVYGGARQANVGGSAFLHIDGEHASSYIVIDKAYGGNDIAGTIGTSNAIPTELTEVGTKDEKKNEIDATWNAFIRISNKDNQKTYIGQLFGGSNGDYTVKNPSASTSGKWEIWTKDATPIKVYEDVAQPQLPDIGKTYLELLGGSIVYAYGGGNNATITDRTVIALKNPSKVVNDIVDTSNPNANTDPAKGTVGEVLTNERFEERMGINTTFSYPSSDEYQIGRMFGGNNKADMAIRPRWNLQQGRIRNLYGGGNEGRMTSQEGLLLQIEGAGMVVDNVYGGCRKADIQPLYDDGTPVPYSQVQLPTADNPNNIPAGYASRVRVMAGHVNNVYGGNDISGNVYGGNTVGIRTHIYGDVYGGGNGSYAYTDNPKLKDDPHWSDMYYNPDEVLAAAGITGVSEKLKSVTALNLIRPNAEKVSILVRGDEGNPAIVDGGLYVGGNSASLRENVEGASSGDQTHIKIGSYSIIDNVFLGNNGENMIKTDEAGTDGHGEGVLRTLSKYVKTDGTLVDTQEEGATKFNSMVLTDKDVFAKYMEGCAMKVKSTVVFESTQNGDGDNYIPYTTQFGSFYCGGNVGSMITDGKTTINFSDKVIIYNKVVGGCNSAFVTPTEYNALYEGGLLGAPDPAPTGSPEGSIGDKLQLNFDGLKIQPRRWNAGHTALEWNTIKSSTGEEVDPVTSGATPENPETSDDDDLDRRFDGGNIYGGCYTSGIVNGNIVININSSIVDREILFDTVEEDETGEDKLYVNDQYHITERHSGVILAEQGMDVLGKALNVFGGGKGVNTEIWGSTTINLNRGYMFQIFGGSEEGGIGKGSYNSTTNKIEYTYDARYSTYINLNGPIAGVSRKDNKTEDIAECEFMYGGGFLGPVAGNCIINLGNGRIFNSFAGACNADIYGHTETYIGTNGFPYVRDFVYGGNDLGGQILSSANFDSRIRNDEVRAKVYNSNMLEASAYMEYVQGRVEKIFGGAYGVYDYKDPHYGKYFYATGGEGTTPANEGHAKTGYHKPFLNNAFINFRPNETNNPLNAVEQIYGAGQGYLGEEEEDLMQNSSYILVDVPQNMKTFQSTEIFGAGESGGVGMGVDLSGESPDLDQASAIIDLLSGHIKAVYGGSYQEGVTRRTVINVPTGSTFRCDKIFGGAYGLYNEYPCDVYESNVNWNSSDALVGGYRTGIYGGNNSYRRTLYSHVNINAPVYYDKANEYYATVYGAGYGKDTWSQYTEVNLNNSARVYEVYGGGQLGRVMNKKSVDAWATQANTEATAAYTTAHAEWKALSADEKAETPEPQAPQDIDLSLGSGYTDTGLDNNLAVARYNGKKYNTNVLINQGADVCGYMYDGSLSGAYAYGGGLGDTDTPNTGDVHGTTYIALLGGKVTKDLYAAGTVGSVNNKYNVATDDFDNPFVASANAYIEGGTARNVYGGGWRGSVGYHEGAISEGTANDILGETHVTIGKLDGTSFVNGVPAIERNAYGGGEGGAVFGTTNITLNKGFIGYRRFNAVPSGNRDYIQVGSDYYQEKLDDETWTGDGTDRLYDSGCIFGGGYIDNSSVDVTNVKMYGGHVRNSLFGGGEIAAVGRGVINASGQDNSVRVLQGIYKAGKATVELFEGNVHRNVFGGGRGYNNLGEGGTLYSDGYVFGQTEVHIFGGTVGTPKELARENGNVFGGGDIGYVYSAYEKDGKLFVGIKDGDRYDGNWEGYYYAYEKGNEAYIPGTKPKDDDENWVMDEGQYVLTEDCKVLIEPHAKAKSAVTINGHNYAAGDYVPTTDLHTLGNKYDTQWDNLYQTGITIYNAVFAGGNTSSGSSTVYANTTTVFGNATASIHDVYHRDLITLGTGRTGGLYGDGNLTFVDGYRGLNITNYGTDYYTLDPEITIEQYNVLPAREADYYQLKYKCILQCTDKDGTTYYPQDEDHTKASTLTIDDMLTLFKDVKDGNVDLLLYNETTGEYYPNPLYWEENGVVPVYAGRPMNTLQRADFCGIFGSRMVMQGAEDRVPEIVDHTNYTINRVREVSLNHKTSVIESDLNLKAGKTRKDDIMDQDPEDFDNVKKAIHGNYFGIYNIVNYLGALTSDVFFLPGKNIRYTENASNPDFKSASKAYEDVTSKSYGEATFYDWKAGFVDERKRNNGTSHNKVALASGVYLELTTEKSRGDDLYEKDWGYITGVIELDLINVQPGMGGGFVYAKNVHKKGSYTYHKHNTLTFLNDDAITVRDFTFDGDDVEWETSGNFIHSTQTIIDDCYNISGKYKGDGAVPAHYWFIKGSVYVYDQYISAYTGAPNAYSETVDIPLTITAASHGKMKLLNVMPNKYAYYSTPGTKIGVDKKIVINDVEYHLNDPINYWDWYMLTSSEKSLFVDETYVTTADCKYSSEDDDIIPAGTVMLPDEYTATKADHPTVYHVEKQQMVDFDFVYRSSNNMSHDTGYMLTYRVNNPTEWNTWYTEKEDDNDKNGSIVKAHEKNQTGGTGYEDGPTYYLTSGEGGVFGQRDYKVSNLISKEVYDTYQNIVTNHSSALPDPDGQAIFEDAYIVTKEYTKDEGDVHIHLNVGSSVSATQAASMTGYVAPAYICTSTIQLSKTEFIYVGSRMTEAEKTAYYNRFKDGTAAEKQIAQDILDNIGPAYYCTKDGLYGGDYYEAGKNYRGLGVWCSMSKEDREHFTFNYDAFDVLIDPLYSKDPNTGNIRYPEGKKYQYDSATATEQAAIDNQAGYSLEKPVNYTATYNGDETSTHNGIELKKNKEYSRTDYESLPNEKRHYTAIDVKEAGNVYVVKSPFQVGNSPYAVGTIISKNTFDGLGDTDKTNITTLTFTDAHKNKTFYYCREDYTIGEHKEGVAVTGVTGIGAEESESNSYAVGSNVPVGVVIAETTYNGLPNWQNNFTIHGIAPTETSTLYVSRFSDIFDLSKEKIITVVYQYDYEESDASGANVTPVSERHVVNIHVLFKSGIPTVEDIKAPQVVLPGTFVGIREPHVTPGAYEVTGGGWKLFEKPSDAESHINGIDYTPQFDPLYWYQNGYYLAYYAKTYLGETYSNTVQVSVANYHDLKKVLEDTEHYYYVDRKDVKRNSKIYITDATDGAKHLKQFFDLSKGTLNEHVRDCQNLEFFLHTNVNHTGSWTPIGDNTNCFEGNFHGDGYHIDGLNNSLFGNLCGNVYNLGVTGTFTSAGIADTGSGYVENCWINTTGTPDSDVYAVFGNPTESGYKRVNCYYPEMLKYNTTSDGHGLARPMPAADFYNGTVAYNLNGFYLFKRYNDQKTTSGTEYKYYTINKNDGTLSTPQTKHYVANAEYCSSAVSGVYANGGYVEDRYADGDFRYADGVIPESQEERMFTDNDGKTYFYPVWPDDYIYFGQMLTYDWNDQRPHQEVPSRIVKNSGRLANTDESNRVYRAPAYYQSKVMNVAHFNPNVNLVAYSKPKGTNDKDLKTAYPNMTAIDFYGHNDTEYKLGLSGGWFYQPLLDEDGLQSITNRDETPNLLVYAPTEEANAQTYDVLTEYFTEPAYDDYDADSYTDHPEYRRVAAAPSSQVYGHLVHSDFTATNDHLLVDKKDFNCPMSYTFDDDKRMWYQRLPDSYLSLTKGWETVSLPFTAELVTTQQKGEITHFYSGSQSLEGSDAKIGHEYWLYEYKGISVPSGSPAEMTVKATFNYPDATGDDKDDKNANNTFLWDYYYSKNTQRDAHADTYQTYYETGRKLEHYPLLTTAQPYIVGFPGKTYREFDLSGEWTAPNTAVTAPAKLAKQTISFVSEPRITIAVSDDELDAEAVDGYKFMPNYMSKKVMGYLMNTDGNGFDMAMTTTEPATPVAVATVPFRPYFLAASNNARQNTRSIIFDSSDSSLAFGDDKDPSGDGFGDGDLIISVHPHVVRAYSSLRREADVRIVNMSGLTIASFTIQPGETIDTNIGVAGVYIVRADGGRIQKKIAVR